MRNIKITDLYPYVTGTGKIAPPVINQSVYMERIGLLLKKMAAYGMSHALVFADREHFSNLEYLTGYDPRFEESMLILRNDGDMHLLVGNEGWAYSYISPVALERVMYQDFSLQGQPRDRSRGLKDIMSDCGIGRGSKVGVIGFKFFDKKDPGEPDLRIDIPSYIVEEAAGLAGRKNVIDFTWTMTHMTEGIRMVIRDISEIAFYEYACNKVSNCVINIFKNLKPGISEIDASIKAGYDASPISMFPIVNFGEEHVKLGLRSPDENTLREGDVITLCYGIRGSLVSRSGMAVYGESGFRKGMEDVTETFFKPFFGAMVNWYESIGVGSVCGDTYNSVMSVIGDRDKFGITLNPGHFIGSDEWVNSPFFKGSGYRLESGCYIQSDIIASKDGPYRQAILEDGVIIADKALRDRLRDGSPDVYGRIMRRKEFMKKGLGINLSDDVLPLSNSQAVLHPYMLDIGKVLTV
jgi:hypothetical protein